MQYIYFPDLQDALLQYRILDLFCDRNSKGDVCEVSLVLENGSEIKIKSATNGPIVFESE